MSSTNEEWMDDEWTISTGWHTPRVVHWMKPVRKKIIWLLWLDLSLWQMCHIFCANLKFNWQAFCNKIGYSVCVCVCVTWHFSVAVQASLSLMRTTTNGGRGVSVLQMASSWMFHQWSWSVVQSGGPGTRTAQFTLSRAAARLVTSHDPVRLVHPTTENN